MTREGTLKIKTLKINLFKTVFFQISLLERQYDV